MTTDTEAAQTNKPSTETPTTSSSSPSSAAEASSESQPATEMPAAESATAGEKSDSEQTETAAQEQQAAVETAPVAAEPVATDEPASAPADASPPAEAATPSEPPAVSVGESADTVAAPAETTTNRPSERLQIGTQRADDVEPAVAKPVTPGPAGNKPAADKPAAPTPVPSVRQELSPELQQEVEAALSGGSIESLIEQSAAAAGSEEEIPAGTKVTATVAKIHREDIFVELGGRNQGILPLKQFEGKEAPEPGSQLDVTVSQFNAEQGLYDVSLPTAAVEVGNWDEVQEGQVVEVKVTGTNKGGLQCEVAGIRGFMPLGQISVFRVENPEEYVGQRLSCVVMEAKKSRKNLVLSHRAVMERERKEKREQLLAELAPGQIHEGVVRSLQDFGAFVDLGGVDGLIHVSQLSWERVNHPKDVLTVGQTVKVRIEKVNKESGKISLAYRDLGANPWDDVTTKYPVGNKVKGTVSKLMQFGAFVKLEPGVEGLIHISELGHGRVNRTSDVLSENQEVEVKVLSVDTDAQRIGLSLKALLPEPEKAKPEAVAESAQEDEQKPQRKKSNKHLKGGISTPSGGEKFGLKW